MTQPTNKERDEAWLLEKLRLEEENGPIVPGGAQGVPKKLRSKTSAAMRARARVRLTFQAIDEAA